MFVRLAKNLPYNRSKQQIHTQYGNQWGCPCIFTPPSSETTVSSASPLSLYDTEEKGKIYPCAEMRITILIFSPCCIVALLDISYSFLRIARDWNDIIGVVFKTFSPAVSRSLTGSRVSYIGKRLTKQAFLRRGVRKIS